MDNCIMHEFLALLNKYIILHTSYINIDTQMYSFNLTSSFQCSEQQQQSAGSQGRSKLVMIGVY